MLFGKHRLYKQAKEEISERKEDEREGGRKPYLERIRGFAAYNSRHHTHTHIQINTFLYKWYHTMFLSFGLFPVTSFSN